ncbi:MAG: hypothetical protein EOM26_12340, partial [Alphaproteobacteria bacterium]|nr:hypothetical protein [Alphaproteobacteria bacterium]
MVTRFYMTGEFTQLDFTLTNPYSSESIAIEDEYYVNNGTYYGSADQDILYMTDFADAFFAVNSVGTQMLMNVETIYTGNMGDLLVLADSNVVLNDMTLNGGEGDDIIWANSGNDTIDGLGGNDILDGGPGNDRVDGDDGDDYVRGGDGDDVVLGGAGDDSLFGDGGNDRLIGGTGTDYLEGGAGDDTYSFARNFGAETIYDSAGIDQIQTGLIPVSSLVFSYSGMDLIIDAGGGDTITVIDQFLQGSEARVETITSNDGGIIVLDTLNFGPEALGGASAVLEDGVLNHAVDAFDINGDTLTYTLVAGPAHGELVLNGDGTFTYTPEENYHGADSFEFSVSDGDLSASGSFALTVEAVND